MLATTIGWDPRFFDAGTVHRNRNARCTNRTGLFGIKRKEGEDVLSFGLLIDDLSAQRILT